MIVGSGEFFSRCCADVIRGKIAAADVGQREAAPDTGIDLQYPVTLEFHHGDADKVQRLQELDCMADQSLIIDADAAGRGPAGDGIFADAAVAEHGDRTAFAIHDQTDTLPVAGDQLLDHGIGVVGGHFFVGGAKFVGIGCLLVALFGVKSQFLAAAGLDDDGKGGKSGGDIVFLRHGNADLTGGQSHRPLVIGSVQNLRRGHQTVADRLKFR